MHLRFYFTAAVAGLAAIVLPYAEGAAELREARVTQIIKDVKLLGGQAVRPAAVSDNVGEGTAVRTGLDSRAELTFKDLTITRLGANTVFTFSEGARQVNLDSGALLLQVPRNGAAVRINTAAVTAAVTGGTALFESNKGFPTKLLVLEGQGTLCSKAHSGECETANGGEMVTMSLDGHITKPQKFDVARVCASAHLITDFPPLMNLDLIQLVIDEQWDHSGGPGGGSPPNDVIDVTSQVAAASPPPSGGSLPSSKFGPLVTITSPDPYVIDSGTTIQTDPTITTNGQTDQGKIYRDEAHDGPVPDYLYGSSRPFDTTIDLNGNGNNGNYAVFRFQNLQLAGDPTISIGNGGATNLALVSVGPITSGGSGGVLTFAGMQRVFIATQDGSITLGPEISFDGIPRLHIYARGSGADLTIASTISNATKINLDAEGNIQVNGNESAATFEAISGGDFLAGSGTVTATEISIRSLSNINFDESLFPHAPGNVGSIILNAAQTLNITLDPSDGGIVDVNRDLFTAQGATINVQSTAPVTWDFGNATAVFTAGSGGIQAANITFLSSGDLDMSSTGGINAQAIVGGNTIDAISGDINVTGDLIAMTVSTENGSIMAGHVAVQNLTTDTGNLNTGNLTAGSGGITPFLTPSGANLQHTFDIDGTVISPAGINFNGNNFGGDSHGGSLILNVDHQIFSPAGINGADFNGSDSTGVGSPADGGGTFTVNAINDITVAAGTSIMATSGNIGDPDADLPVGGGGEVNLNSTDGTVTVNGLIQVSSNEPNLGSGQPFRSSASGGDITITSGRTVADSSAISIGSTARLLSLLDLGNSASPGVIGGGGGASGGTIIIEATQLAGASSIDIDNTNGLIEADGGTVDIRHQGANGIINLTNANIVADMIKITAFGSDGTLNIGGGTISANTMLKLFASGSNGSINFIANVSLDSEATATIIQAVHVTINNGVIVTISGPDAAEVFTDHPNYASLDTGGHPTGGNDTTTGQFAGSGAHTSPFSGPTPPPDKFGPPSTITSPDPYVITSSTVINTDPTITTGVTDEGRIYRDPATDGPRADWMFGSTSAFDTTSGFADGFDSFQMNNMAVFKFTNLQITGDPTVITTGVDAVQNLGLIGVNGITTGGAGGPLTFNGVSMLLLATQNGSITLGGEFTFSGLDRMHIYARGTGSNLTIGSGISTNNDLRLYSQGTVQVNGDVNTSNFSSFSGGDWLNGSGEITAGGVYITSLGNITLDGSDIPDVDGGAISANATGILTVAVTGGTNTRESFDLFGATINLTSATPVVLDLVSAVNPSVNAGAGGIQAPNVGFIADNLTLESDGDINVYSLAGHNSSVSGTVNAAGAFHATSNVDTGSLTTGTSVFVGGDLFVSTVDAGTTIEVGGFFSAFQATADGNITAGTVRVLNLDAPGGVLTAGSGGIIPLIFIPGGENPQHTFNVSSIVSPNGINFQIGEIYDGFSSDGGKLTINATTLRFDPAGGIAFANFSGADANSFSGGGPPNGGGGGVFIVNATNDITAVNGADISATTGSNSNAGVYSGAGGTVTLHSTGGTVTVDSTIQVSSDEPSLPSGQPYRASASGGNINLTSNKDSGVAINVGNSGQLLALLNAAAPGPGGKITILATGATSQANVSGNVWADRGTVDIRNTGDSGQVNLAPEDVVLAPSVVGPGNTIDIRADIVKVGALGPDGTLTIGAGTIRADTILRLYAGGSNGTVNFIADVSLNGASTKIIAGNTVNIFNGVTVTIGGSSAAQVYTNHPNYASLDLSGNPTGGNDTTTGQFAGAGATTDVLTAAPGFDDPAGPNHAAKVHLSH